MRVRLTSPDAAMSPADRPEDDDSGKLDLHRWLVREPDATYFMRVAGSQMQGAGLEDGDVLVVSRAHRPRQGDLVVVTLHAELCLRRLAKLDGRLVLAREEQSGTLTADTPAEDVEVWGVVTGMARSLRD